jgi:hypothetical protein
MNNPLNDFLKKIVDNQTSIPVQTQPTIISHNEVVIERYIEEWSRYPNGERYFIKKYPIGQKVKEKKAPKKEKDAIKISSVTEVKGSELL